MKNSKPSLNSFKLSHTSLPVPHLLCAKLLVLYWLLNKHFLYFPQPFLPFLSFFDYLGPPVLIQQIYQWSFFGFAIMLLINRKVRLASFMCGLVILLCILGSRHYYSNSRFFFAVYLILLGLYDNNHQSKYLRLQLVLVYLGAALNKILDVDWRCGQYFEFWARDILQLGWYDYLSAQLPSMFLSQIFSWLTITAEGVLAIGFLIEALNPFAIFLGILLHGGMLVFTEGAISVIFFYCTLSAYVIFLQWPKKPLKITYPRQLSLIKKIFEKIDFEKIYSWEQGNVFTLTHKNHLYKRLEALIIMLRYSPPIYFLLAAIFVTVF